jgi:heme oxygenase
VLPITRADVTLSEYRDHLRFLISFHEPMESRLRQVDGLDGALPDLSQRWKTGSLRCDLGHFANGPRPSPRNLPDPRSIPQALGTLYVLEGATLGARALLHRLHKTGLIPGEIGSAYLSGYGPSTSEMWATVCATFALVPEREADQLISSAMQTFMSLLTWRRQWEQLT